MKKLKKLNLKNISLMTGNEMKMIVGGYGSAPGDGECSGTKVSVCEGKSSGTSCCFTYNSRKYYGKCQAYFPNYVMHCSDLN